MMLPAEKIIAEYKEGRGPMFLAKKYSCDKGTIRRLLVRHGETIRGLQRSISFTPGQKLGVWVYVAEAETVRRWSNARGKNSVVRRHVIRCSNCGIEQTRDQGNIKPADVTGCLNCSLLPRGEAGLRQVYNAYVQRAKDRGGEVKMTVEQFRELTSRPCVHCGVRPENLKKGRFGNADWSQYYYNGLDRKDTIIRDYTLDNSEPCCFICNRAKSDSTPEEFEEWKNRLVKFHYEKCKTDSYIP